MPIGFAMESLAATLFTAIITFAATNVDDLLILTLFFSQTKQGFRKQQIVTGQYLGFLVLVLLSMPGFFGGQVLPREWIGLLGLLPIIIGVRKFLDRAETIEPAQFDETVSPRFFVPLISRQALGVAGVTIANGGDNIGIYMPLFAGSTITELGILLGVFFVLVGVWCFAGDRLARQPAVAGGFAHYGHILGPVVLVGLGIVILVESETYRLLYARFD